MENDEIFYRMIFIKKIHKFFDQHKAKKITFPSKLKKKITNLGLDEIGTFI
jgi:hypothetical protein